MRALYFLAVLLCGLGLREQLQTEAGPLLKFLKDEAPDQNGRMLQDMLEWSNEKLETEKKWLGWMFPTDDDDDDFSVNWPLLSEEDTQILKQDEHMKSNLRKCLKKICEFLGLQASFDGPTGQAVTIHQAPDIQNRIKDLWQQPFSNVERAIGHVQDSLQVAGLNEEAAAFKKECTKIIGEALVPNCGPASYASMCLPVSDYMLLFLDQSNADLRCIRSWCAKGKSQCCEAQEAIHEKCFKRTERANVCSTR